MAAEWRAKNIPDDLSERCDEARKAGPVRAKSRPEVIAEALELWADYHDAVHALACVDVAANAEPEWNDHAVQEAAAREFARARQTSPGSETAGTAPDPPRDRSDTGSIASPEEDGQPDPAPAGPTIDVPPAALRDFANLIEGGGNAMVSTLREMADADETVAKGNEATDRLQAAFTQVDEELERFAEALGASKVRPVCDGHQHPAEARLVRAWGTTCDRVKGGCGAVIE